MGIFRNTKKFFDDVLSSIRKCFRERIEKNPKAAKEWEELSGDLKGLKKKDAVVGFIIPFFLLAIGMVSPCFTDSFKVIFCAFVPFYGWGGFASLGSKNVRELIFGWYFVSSILSLVFVSICSWTTFIINFVVAGCFALYSFISISSDYYWNIWWWLGGGRDDD